MARDFLPFAVWYGGGRARAPMQSRVTSSSRAEWGEDLRRIRALGFNTVRTWVSWADCEPREGERDFEALHLLCALAEEVGLRVLVQVYAEATPLWFSRRHEAEAAFVTQTGERLISQIAPGVCTDHGPVREGVLDFYRALAREVTQHDCFHGWDLWSEPHIVNWTIVRHIPNVEFCHCAHTRARFREWLRGRHGDLDSLNRAWNRHHATWEEVEPPRFGTILTCTDFLDWKAFTLWKMAEDLRMRAEAVRGVDRDHVIMSHAAVPSGLTSPLSEWGGYGATDDFRMADTVDLYGLSLYPKHSFPERHWEPWKIDYALGFAASANRQHGGFQVGELQAGPGARGVVVGDPISGRDLKRWIWSALGHGAKSVNLYAYHPMSSGYEAGGYGLRDRGDTPTDRDAAVRETGRVVDQNMDLLLEARPEPAQVALVYNPLAQLAGGEQSSGPTALHADSLIGYHRALTARGIPVDIIHRRDLEADDLPSHRLLILPHAIALTRSAAAGLRRHVERGGCALAEGRLAWTDERGFTSDAIPGLGLAEVFGAEEISTLTRETGEMRVTATGHPALEGIAPETALPAAHCIEAVTTRGSGQVLAEWDSGEPAAIASRFGEGETLLLGTLFGLTLRLRPSLDGERLILNALSWAGVERPLTSSLDGVLSDDLFLYPMRSGEGRILVAVNHGERRRTFSVQLRVSGTGLHRIVDLLTGEEYTLDPQGGNLPIDLDVPGGEVAVISAREVRVR